VSVLTGLARPPAGPERRSHVGLRRGGVVALAVVVAAWLIIAALILRHRIFATHDSLINYAHVWWIESQLWHGSGIPWHMPVLGHGEALTFPYGVLPWMVSALLWPALGEWAVTAALVLGALGLIAVTFWAFPESRQPWWAVVVLANPILVLAPLSGQLPFLWAASLLVVAIGCWRRGHVGWAVVFGGLAQLCHAAVVLPLAALVVLIRLRWEPRRRLLLGCYLLSLLIAAPAIYPILASPVFSDSSPATKLAQLAGTVLIRAGVLVPPVLAALLARRARPWVAPALAAVAVALNLALLAPLDAGFSWAALDRTPDQTMTAFAATSEFHPGATYRVLYTADGKVGMYQLIRHGAVLDSEFFPESIWHGRFADERAYSTFLAGRHVNYVLLFRKVPTSIRTNEGVLLRNMASSGRSCSGDTVGVRLVEAHAGWDDYAIDFSCLQTRVGAADARPSG
jgi:hypothetical protein